MLPGITLYPTSTDAEVDERIAGCEFILTNKLNISRARMRAVPGLRFIGLTATGTNNVDLEAARELGIAVCNIRDYCTVSVAQHVLGVDPAADASPARVRPGRGRRHLVDAANNSPCPARRSASSPARCSASSASARSARAVAKAAQRRARHARAGRASGPGTAPGREADTTTSIGPVRVTLDEVLRSADVLSLHCPLTPATTGLIGKRELALMKPDALLINTARGALVDLDALVAALRGGDLGGAAIDVLPQEPPVERQPAVRARYSESARHAAHRLGGVRGAPARGG